uniref:Uncharacterized protein n=1 Tax=Sipha flava TaxID=143950 RepID=A0A2S2QU02_9HEMI
MSHETAGAPAIPGRVTTLNRVLKRPDEYDTIRTHCRLIDSTSFYRKSVSATIYGRLRCEYATYPKKFVHYSCRARESYAVSPDPASRSKAQHLSVQLEPVLGCQTV